MHKLALGYEKSIAAMKSAAAPPAAAARRGSAQPQPAGSAEHRPARRNTGLSGGKRKLPPHLLKKRGPRSGPAQTEAQQRSATQRQAERLRARRYQAMAACSLVLGGEAALTSFFVYMLVCVVKKTGTWTRNVFLQRDVVGQVLDDPALFKSFSREIDKRRKPPICQFVIAHLTGVTYTAMDKMRFATAWCPGHSTLLGEIKRLEMHIEATWCPSGPTAAHGTTRTAAEQAGAAAEAARAASEGTGEGSGAGAPGLDDQELAALDEEAAAAVAATGPQDARGAAEDAAEARQEQGLALLRLEFPDATDEKLWDRWAGGMDDENGVFVGANIVHVMAMRGGKLLGFVKALRTKTEVFVDEVLVAEEERGPQGLNTHMFRKLATTIMGRQRLQVKETSPAIKSYRRMGYNNWNPSAGSSFAEVEADPHCVFMHAPRATVEQKTESFCKERPLAEGTQLLLCAAMPITGTTFDYVGKPTVAEGQEPPPLEPDGGLPRAQDGGACPKGPTEEEVTDPNADAGRDDATNAAIDNGRETGKVATSWGANSVSSAAATMLNGTHTRTTPHAPPPAPHTRTRSCLAALCEEEVPLPGSPQTKPCIKITGDAANLSNAPKSKRVCTTIILQLLSLGAGANFDNMVKYMVTLPQSCKNAFTLRLWFGKDDAANVRCGPPIPPCPRAGWAANARTAPVWQCKAHLVPHMVEGGQIEKDGLKVNGGRNAPPFWNEAHVARLRPEAPEAEGGAPAGGGAPEAPAKKAKKTLPHEMRRLPIETLPGTKVNGGTRQTLRKVNVEGILLLPVFMYAFDGATTMYLAGCTHQSGQTDPFSNEMKADTKLFHRIAVIRQGKSLTDVAESISPGCSSRSSNMHWLLAYLVMINHHAWNSDLQAATREPERESEENLFESLGKKAKRVFKGGQEDDGRSNIRQPYCDADIEDLGYDHAAFVPDMDGSCADALTAKADTDGLIRVPVMVEHYSRELPKAAWKGQDPTGSISMRRFGLCIIHAGMRTAESCATLMLERALTHYLDGKGRAREAGDACNARVRRDLKLRKLFSVNKERKLNPISFNGEEVRILMEDLAGDDSKIIAAFKELYSSLGIAPANHKLDAWAAVMGHWARAFNAAYVMRATQGDRDTFRSEVAFYVAKKAMLRAGACTWYDFQLYSIMPVLFDTFKSLMVISQEGMEACQAAQNRFLRWSNHFTNAGRIPFKVLQAGFEATRVYLATRLKQVKSPEWWLWCKNMNCFYATHHAAFEAVEACKQQGRSWSWQYEYCPRWQSFKAISRVRICAGAHLKRVKVGGGRFAPMSISTRGGFLGLRHPVHKKQVTFPKSDKGLRVTQICSGYGVALARELIAYYMPVDCESSMPPDIDDLTKRKLIQRERRKRWAKLQRDPDRYDLVRPLAHVMPRAHPKGTAGRVENTEW